MNVPAKVDQPRLSLIAAMAHRYNMEPATFAATLRATVVPKNASNEEFAAFLLVAREHNLNPITREIYAFPKQGGGIQPIVSVDGWANLINSHPQCDGIEFDDRLDGAGNLVSITCRIYRKDRSRPTTATEYMAECHRPTPTWKQWPRRMLRHKALIQAARYAFGFAGIVDPDEAERFTVPANNQIPQPPAPPPSVPPKGPPAPPVPPIPPDDPSTGSGEPEIPDTSVDPDTGEILDESEPEETSTEIFDRLEEALSLAKDSDQVIEIWKEFDALAYFEGRPNGEIDQGIALAIYRRQLKRVGVMT